MSWDDFEPEDGHSQMKVKPTKAKVLAEVFKLGEALNAMRDERDRLALREHQLEELLQQVTAERDEARAMAGQTDSQLPPIPTKQPAECEQLRARVTELEAKCERLRIEEMVSGDEASALACQLKEMTALARVGKKTALDNITGMHTRISELKAQLTEARARQAELEACRQPWTLCIEQMPTANGEYEAITYADYAGGWWIDGTRVDPDAIIAWRPVEGELISNPQCRCWLKTRTMKGKGNEAGKTYSIS